MNLEMAAIFSNMMDLINPDQLHDMKFDLLQDLPFHLYWKNYSGKYQGSNDCQAQDAGAEKGENLLGLTDYDLSWKNEASKLRDNDIKVMECEKSIIFYEKGRSFDGTLMNAISYKAPVRLRSNKIVGVMGFTMIIRENNTNQTSISSLEPINRITRRQNECLHYLAKGMTMKQIARILNLSPRTIEHHIESAKIKLGCFSRAHLIEKILAESGDVNFR